MNPGCFGQGLTINMAKANNSNYWNYNPRLKKFASDNRRNMTKAEACLWKYVIGGRQLLGYRFNRQRPVGTYIADFMCKELMLIVEVDWVTHQFEEVSSKDRIRENELKEMGFSIIRFVDDDVLSDLENIRLTLLAYVERRLEDRE